MIDYRAGDWGFHVALGWKGSLVPKALIMAIPNAVVTMILATAWQVPGADDIDAGVITDFHDDTAQAAQMVIAAFTTIMTFILYRRSSVAYDRWWEGGTLLQKMRGEWFNAYSSIMAFTSTKPEMQEQVEAYIQLLTRLMSLLMCCGLQQVSPNRDRGFEIVDLSGIEVESMEFLNSAPDKVEIILQWIQRSMVLHMQTGVLPIAPPILSRAFQEVSRGIVNLQNARKIADFPYPYPLAQISMILQIVHFLTIPVGSSLALPRMWAVLFSFVSIFTLWCIHFNAIELEFPFGTRANDLPMVEFQQEWNKSLTTLACRKAVQPPQFAYNPHKHSASPSRCRTQATCTSHALHLSTRAPQKSRLLPRRTRMTREKTPRRGVRDPRR
jgi:predicted membrane chloride channel (bestrophin family)